MGEDLIYFAFILTFKSAALVRATCSGTVDTDTPSVSRVNDGPVGSVTFRVVASDVTQAISIARSELEDLGESTPEDQRLLDLVILIDRLIDKAHTDDASFVSVPIDKLRAMRALIHTPLDYAAIGRKHGCVPCQPNELMS